MLLRDFYLDTYAPFKQGNPKPTTQIDYLSVVRQFSKWLDRDAELSDLNRDTIRQFLAWKLQRTTPATANGSRAVLIAFWKFAEEEGLLDQPATIRKYKVALDDPEAWFPHEIDAILAAAVWQPGYVCDVPAGVFWPTLILSVYNTGVRVSAIMSTKTEDYTRDADGDGWLTVRGMSQKNSKGKAFKLFPGTAECIDRLLSYPAYDDTLFGCWRPDRTQLGWKRLTAGLTEIQEKAGLPTTPKHKWHRLRKSCCSHVAAKAGIGVARLAMGHSDDKVTLRYIDERQVQKSTHVEHLPVPKIPELPQTPLRVVDGEVDDAA